MKLLCKTFELNDKINFHKQILLTIANLCTNCHL